TPWGYSSYEAASGWGIHYPPRIDEVVLSQDVISLRYRYPYGPGLKDEFRESNGKGGVYPWTMDLLELAVIVVSIPDNFNSKIPFRILGDERRTSGNLKTLERDESRREYFKKDGSEIRDIGTV
ncbi:hypothetical protein JMJ77_0001229, partial [Colletotrichum scovillei]